MVLAGAAMAALASVGLVVGDRVRSARIVREKLARAHKPAPDLSGAAMLGSLVGRAGAHFAALPIYTFSLVTLNPAGIILTAGAANLAGGAAGAYAGASLAAGRPLTADETVAAVRTPADASLAVARALQGLTLP